MTVIGIVKFTDIFFLSLLPIKHVSIECIDTVSNKKILFEHPNDNKIKYSLKGNNSKPVNKVIIGKSTKSLEYIEKNIKKPSFYFPLINDCRCHVLEVCKIAEFPNYTNIRKSIRMANYKE